MRPYDHVYWCDRRGDSRIARAPRRLRAVEKQAYKDAVILNEVKDPVR